MKIFVLGAGMMGRAVVHDLAGTREVRGIAVADFDRERAAEVAKKFGQGRAHALFADVRATSGLAKLLRGSEVVVNCTQYNWNLDVMRAALAARVNYMDLGGLYHMTNWTAPTSSRNMPDWPGASAPSARRRGQAESRFGADLRRMAGWPVIYCRSRATSRAASR